MRAPIASVLRGLCGGAVHLPGDPGYDAARAPWNLAVDQRPAAIVYPADEAEVSEVIRAVAATGLRVAPQGTGHNPGPLGPLDDVVLLRTAGMLGVEVNPGTRRARTRAGTLWVDAVEAAAPYGLAALHPTAPDVGVVGYSLGGGIGWYARRYGQQANYLTAIELITATGARVRAEAGRESALFWALRGGGGNFGVVTAVEFELLPITTSYAGALVWDSRHAHRVLTRWAQWAPDAPDSVTSTARLLRTPAARYVPEPMRDRWLVIIDAVLLDDDRSVLAPLRELRPELDTFAVTPAAALPYLHLDPVGPTPTVTDSTVLGALPAAGVETLLAAADPGSPTAPHWVELRQLGGALARPHPDAGALPCLDGEFMLLAATTAPTAPDAARGLAAARRLIEAMEPYANGRQLLNFSTRAGDAAAGYAPGDWDRLRAVRAEVDPGGLFVANHAVPR